MPTPKKQPTTKNCDWCGEEFSAVRFGPGARFFCRQKCRDELAACEKRTGPVVGNCPECGTFFVRKTTLALTAKTYCTEKCRRQRDKKRQRKRGDGRRRERIGTCPHCGKDFERLAKNHIYCTRKCANGAASLKAEIRKAERSGEAPKHAETGFPARYYTCFDGERPCRHYHACLFGSGDGDRFVPKQGCVNGSLFDHEPFIAPSLKAKAYDRRSFVL